MEDDSQEVCKQTVLRQQLTCEHSDPDIGHQSHCALCRVSQGAQESSPEQDLVLHPPPAMSQPPFKYRTSRQAGPGLLALPAALDYLLKFSGKLQRFTGKTSIRTIRQLL